MVAWKRGEPDGRARGGRRPPRRSRRPDRRGRAGSSPRSAGAGRRIDPVTVPGADRPRPRRRREGRTDAGRLAARDPATRRRPAATALGCPAMRLAVLSDIHANLVALDAVLAAVGSVDGDPAPRRRRRLWPRARRRRGAPDGDRRDRRPRQPRSGGAGRPRDRLFNPDARTAMEWTRGRIAPATRAWLAALPERRARTRSRSSTAARATRPGSTSRRSPVARANLAVLDDAVSASSATPTCRSVPADERRAVEPIEPADGRPFDPRRPARRSSTRAASASRATGSDGRLARARHGRAAVATWHRTAYDIARDPARDAARRACRRGSSTASRSAL